MRLLSALGTLLGSLLGLLGPSWGVSRAKKCRQSHAKSTFSKVFLLVSRSPFWFSWAPLGLSRARLGAQMAPKRGPKGSLKWVQKWIQKWGCFWTALGPILGPILGSKIRQKVLRKRVPKMMRKRAKTPKVSGALSYSLRSPHRGNTSSHS